MKSLLEDSSSLVPVGDIAFVLLFALMPMLAVQATLPYFKTYTPALPAEFESAPRLILTSRGLFHEGGAPVNEDSSALLEGSPVVFEVDPSVSYGAYYEAVGSLSSLNVQRVVEVPHVSRLAP